MSPLQTAAFTAANRPGMSPAELKLLITGVLALMALLWLVWVALAVYRHGALGLDAGGVLLRALFVLLLLLTLVSY